jgi:hypothetical protein
MAKQHYEDLFPPDILALIVEGTKKSMSTAINLYLKMNGPGPSRQEIRDEMVGYKKYLTVVEDFNKGKNIYTDY